MIVGGLLDTCIADWIDSDHVHIVELSFMDFMKEFCASYLDEDWEEDTCQIVLGMTQGANTFWDYTIALQSKNSLLHGTTLHISDEQICLQLGAGMEVCLSKKIGGEKVNKVVDFHKWLNEVKRYDNQLHDECEEYEHILKESRNTSRYANTATEPSRESHHIPNSGKYQASSNTASSSVPPNGPHKQYPPLQQSECWLLNSNDSCLKCHHFFVDHHATNCPNNFPSPINYHTLTQVDVDWVKCGCTKPMVAIATAAVPTSSVSDTSIDGSAPTPKFHQVAVVMGMSSNPVSYITNNTSNIIGDTNSGSESDGDSVAGVSSPQNALSTTPTAPLHVPHLYWRCLMGSGSQEFPVSFNAFIDHGSSSVLIHNSHTNFLGLHHKCL